MRGVQRIEDGVDSASIAVKSPPSGEVGGKFGTEELVSSSLETLPIVGHRGEEEAESLCQRMDVGCSVRWQQKCTEEDEVG